MTTNATAIAEAGGNPASTETVGDVVFFDGVCALCNSTVDFLMRRDRHRRLSFAPLQGETSKQLIDQDMRENLSTIVLRTAEGATYTRSGAIVRILWRLGGVWALLAPVLWLIPRPLRDAGYRTIARFRYRMFGHRETCRMPGPEDTGRLLP